QWAYLINRFHLRNAYLTNVVKCGVRSALTKEILSGAAYMPWQVTDNCASRFLSKEIQRTKPVLIAAIGDDAEKQLKRQGFTPSVKLLHPAARGLSTREKISKNEDSMRDALRRVLHK